MKSKLLHALHCSSISISNWILEISDKTADITYTFIENFTINL